MNLYLIFAYLYITADGAQTSLQSRSTPHTAHPTQFQLQAANPWLRTCLVTCSLSL